MEQQTGFDKLYCSLVKAGETAGVLDVILEKLSSHLENQEKIKKLHRTKKLTSITIEDCKEVAK